MNPPTIHDCPELPAPRPGDTALLAQLAPGKASTELDFDTIADTIHEAIEHAQRARGIATPQTTWWDAATAAELLLFHVANTAGE